MTRKFIASVCMLRALLLCTDASAVQTVTRVFKDLGVEVETSTNLEAAIDQITAHKFDAIMVDDPGGRILARP